MEPIKKKILTRLGTTDATNDGNFSINEINNHLVMFQTHIFEAIEDASHRICNNFNSTDTYITTTITNLHKQKYT